MMALGFKIRDLVNPRQKIVKEIGLKAGFHVLDFGCGPGGYILPVSLAIGASGKLYALDAYPLAIEMVKKIIAKNGLTNVETVFSDSSAGFAAESLDVVLLYDIFHDLPDQNVVLKDLHRVLKPTGVLSFSDHHLKEYEITSKVTGTGLFNLKSKGKYTYAFTKKP
jgi:ubiquinone/menaquinone biosynthesis C-methylase UbiE